MDDRWPSRCGCRSTTSCGDARFDFPISRSSSLRTRICAAGSSWRAWNHCVRRSWAAWNYRVRHAIHSRNHCVGRSWRTGDHRIRRAGCAGVIAHLRLLRWLHDWHWRIAGLLVVLLDRRRYTPCVQIDRRRQDDFQRRTHFYLRIAVVSQHYKHGGPHRDGHSHADHGVTHAVERRQRR